MSKDLKKGRAELSRNLGKGPREQEKQTFCGGHGLASFEKGPGGWCSQNMVGKRAMVEDGGRADGKSPKNLQP